MKLVPILESGKPETELDGLSTDAAEFLGVIQQLSVGNKFVPPWHWYLALDDNECVGSCAFKTPPQNGRVEIAYFTFPDNEGQGVATRMAGELLAIAYGADPAVQVIAQTLPEESASTAILKKLRFKFDRDLIHPEDGLVWEWVLPKNI